LWGNDQKNIQFTPAQIASDGGQTPVILDSAAIRVASGVGLSWASPVGPIRLDFGFPLKKEPYDKTQFFRVSFGTKF
jgi:outer membrane protein insertion porin family